MTAALVLLAGAVAASLAVSSIGWSHAISDWWGWRQTQTAITAYFMQQGGPWLRYETPVLGPPWRIPHEFPLYQAVVVVVSSALHLPLEAAGRAVSIAFFYLALGSGYLLLAELGVSRAGRLLMLTLWLASPQYLFWSRTFMIESTALCLCVAFLAFSARFFARSRAIDAVAAVIAGSLGAAVKPPTVAVFVALAGLWWLSSQGRKLLRLQPAALIGGVVAVLPLAAGWLWQQYADTLKGIDTNPLAWGLASRQLFVDWIKATEGYRLQPAVWAQLWQETVPAAVGHQAAVVAGALAVLIARRRRLLFLLCVGGFLTHYAVFTQLDYVHAYYWYAMAVFLVAAVGFAVIALLECDDRRRWLAWPLLGLVVTTCAYTYVTRMLPIQRRDDYRKPAWTIRLARAITDATRPEDVIVGFGMAWDPELPYYAKRRAVMWPDWGDTSPDGRDVLGTIANLEGYTVGAVFVCTRGVSDSTIDRFRDRWGLAESPYYRGRCELYVRPSAPAPASSP
jgi:hypothetical protein